MSALPIIILHGWSDNSTSFQPLADWLKTKGFDVVEIFLGDYLSMNDEITLFDLGYAFQLALKKNGIAQKRHSFDLIVHSTGGLVVREYLRQICLDPQDGTPDASLTPVVHVCMLAPANFGSPLAAMGKSVIGRFFKGWSWTHFAQSGQQVLNALELASPYTFQLGIDDLFNRSFRVFSPENTIATVIVGTAAYTGIASTMHEDGSDGTVRVSTANLNATYLSIEFPDASNPPELFAHPRVNPDIAFAVFHRNHSSITRPVSDSDFPNLAQQPEWQKTLLDAITLNPDDYSSHVQRCTDIANKTFNEGVVGPNPLWYHRYQHVVFHVHDQFGASITDYVVEFYQEDNDESDEVMQEIHKYIITKTTTDSLDGAYRSFMIDTDALTQYVQKTGAAICMSITATNVSERITYRNPESGFEVFTNQKQTLLHPNEPVLVDITLFRDPNVDSADNGVNVFRLTKR